MMMQLSKEVSIALRAATVFVVVSTVFIICAGGIWLIFNTTPLKSIVITTIWFAIAMLIGYFRDYKLGEISFLKEFIFHKKGVV